MDYRRFQDTVVLRLDPGDEVCSSVLKVAELEQIRLAENTGIGAARSFSIGVFDPKVKQYFENSFEGAYEITSLLGSLTRKDGKPYLHLHMNAGDDKGAAFGGHLTKAVIGVTGEIFLRCLDGEVGRKMSEEIGINLFDF